MILYVLIVLVATMIGAITGLGGGVIIKPLFDAIGLDGPTTISFYSSVAVFTMCLVTIYKQMVRGFVFKWRLLSSISVGSILGGLLGDRLFAFAVAQLHARQVSLIQASLLFATLLIILLYTLMKPRLRSYRLDNPVMVFMVGLFLGALSVFLGIGGGPLNVALLMWLFSLSMKEAAAYSIATIFFSQLSNLATTVFTRTFLNHPLTIVPFLMLAAVLGAFLGTLLNQKMTEKTVERCYIGLMLALVCLSIFNIFQNL